MDASASSNNELETLWRRVSEELGREEAAPFHDALLFRTAVSSIPLLLPDISYRPPGLEDDQFLLFQFRSLLGQSSFLAFGDHSLLQNSTRPAYELVRINNHDGNTWTNSRALPLRMIDDSAKRLNVNTNSQDREHISQCLSNFLQRLAPKTYKSELERLSSDLQAFPKHPFTLLSPR